MDGTLLVLNWGPEEQQNAARMASVAFVSCEARQRRRRRGRDAESERFLGEESRCMMCERSTSECTASRPCHFLEKRPNICGVASSSCFSLTSWTNGGGG